jgi:hypothetical protein
MNIKRGTAFALVGCGKSGLFKEDRKGYKIRADRKNSKNQLRKIYS